jgi:hypothetical protein
MTDYFAIAVDAARRANAEIQTSSTPPNPLGMPLCHKCGQLPAQRDELYSLCAMCELCEETRDERCAVCEIEPVKDGYLPTCGSMACREQYEQEWRS